MAERIFQLIVEEMVDEGAVSWYWHAFGEDVLLAEGKAKTLLECVDLMRAYVADGRDVEASE